MNVVPAINQPAAPDLEPFPIRLLAAAGHRYNAILALGEMRSALDHLDAVVRFSADDEIAFQAACYAMGRSIERFDIAMRAYRECRDCVGEG